MRPTSRWLHVAPLVAVLLAHGVRLRATEQYRPIRVGTSTSGSVAGRVGIGSGRATVIGGSTRPLPYRGVTFGGSRITSPSGRPLGALARPGIGSTTRLRLGTTRFRYTNSESGRVFGSVTNVRQTGRGPAQVFIIRPPGAAPTRGPASGAVAPQQATAPRLGRPTERRAPMVRASRSSDAALGTTGGVVPDGTVSAGFRSVGTSRAGAIGRVGRPRGTSYDYYLMRGRRALARQQHFEAGGHFLNAILERPGDPMARLAFAQAKLAGGELGAACRAARAAVRVAGGHINDQWIRKSDYQDREALNAQFAVLRTHVAEKPNDAERVFLLGMLYLLSGQADRAAEHFRRASTLSPGDPVLRALAAFQPGLPRRQEHAGKRGQAG